MTGRPYPASGSAASAPSGRDLTKRQYVRYAFYRVDPVWRRLPPEQQEAHKREFIEVVEHFNRKMLLRPYSLMGTRADVELMLWQIAENLEVLHEFAAAVVRTDLGAYLSMPHSLLSQTKRSIYTFPDLSGEEADRLTIQPTEAKYLFVYPFLKTRPWYRTTMATRQGMMNEHVEVGRKYPSVQLNTSYSFGLDDQEFVVAFETDEPADFLDLVQELRETEASLYTLRDTPLFACIRMTLAQCLDALGGPPVAEEHPVEEERAPAWVEAGPLEEFGPGSRKLVYVGAQQVALFNVDGELMAVANRCPHARGPLSEGNVNCRADGRCTVTCPWHYAEFDLKTGEVVAGIANRPVASFKVEVRDGIIHVGNEPA